MVGGIDMKYNKIDMQYYKVGDKVRIKSLDWYNECKSKVLGTVYDITPRFIEGMSKYCGQVATIIEIVTGHAYKISLDSGCYDWSGDAFEGLVEEETASNIIEETKTHCDSMNTINGEKNNNQLNHNNMELNKKVIIRADRAGVFYGTIVRKNGDEVELKDCRRIWYWNGAASLSELALSGVKRDGNKFSVTVDSIVILGVIEIIPCTEEAIKNIESVPEWRA